MKARPQLGMFELPRRAKKLKPDVAARVSELLGDVERMRESTRCPVCGCDASGPRCTVVLAGGAGVGACVPRGRHDLTRCSACLDERKRTG